MTDENQHGPATNLDLLDVRVKKGPKSPILMKMSSFALVISAHSPVNINHGSNLARTKINSHGREEKGLPWMTPWRSSQSLERIV
jgi:hypothetical protein